MTVCDRGEGVKNKNNVSYFMDSPLFSVQCSVLFSLTCFENRLVGVVYIQIIFVLLHWLYIGDWLDVHLDPSVTCPLVNYIN